MVYGIWEVLGVRCWVAFGFGIFCLVIGIW